MVHIDKSEGNQAPLSYGQQRMWFIEQFEQGSSAYLIPMFFELAPGAHKDAVQQALSAIVERHSILRTVIEQDEQGAAVQRVLPHGPQMRTVRVPEQEDVQRQMAREAQRPFELTEEPPMRVWFYEQGQRCWLLVVFHHIGFDGWSHPIWQREFDAYYAREVRGQPVQLEELTVQYKDYAAWQRTHVQDQALQVHADYWKDKLEGLEPLELCTDHPRPAHVDYRGDNVDFTLSEELSQALRELAQSQGCSMHSVLLTGLMLLLRVYGQRDDVAVGLPVANRDYGQVQSLIGFFVNTLVLRQPIEGKSLLEEVLGQVHRGVGQAQLHQALPFEHLIDLLEVERDTSRHPLFQVMFVMAQQSPSQTEEALMPQQNLSLETVSKFDLTLQVEEGAQTCAGSFNYATALFERYTIEQMARHYERLLEHMAQSLSQRVGELSVLSSEERDQLLVQFNETDQPLGEPQTLVQSFEAQARARPEQTALVDEQECLSYQSLNAQANQLARLLRQVYQEETGNPMSPDTPIALLFDRGTQMVVSLLAVLKAGGAYVPIDPDYPTERIAFMLQDCRSPVVLTQSFLRDHLVSP